VLDTASDNPPELRRSRRVQTLEAGTKLEVQARSIQVLRRVG
jgi:hypothetical protein